MPCGISSKNKADLTAIRGKGDKAMKLHIKWRYPDEEKTHENTFYGINPAKTNINYGFLYFEAMENPQNKHWTFPLTHIVEMHMEEE